MSTFSGRRLTSSAWWVLSIVAFVIGMHAFFDPGLVPGKGDAGSYFPALLARFRELVRLREFFFDPAVANGTVAWANPQYGFFYPPSWIALFVPAHESLRLILFLHWGVFVAGVLLLGRRIGVEWVLLLPFSMLLAFRGAFLSIATMVQNFQTLAWLPWLVALSWRKPRGRSDLIGTFAVAYLFFAAGEPSMALIVGGSYFLGLCVLRKWSDMTIFLLAAVAQPWLIPFAFEVLTGDRAHGLRSMTDLPWQLSKDLMRSVWNPWAILRPDMWTWWGVQQQPMRPNWIMNLHMGLVAIPLAWVGFQNLRRGRLPLILVAAGLVLLSLGERGSLLTLVHSVPPFTMIRYPVRYLLGIDAMLMPLMLLGLRELQARGIVAIVRPVIICCLTGSVVVLFASPPEAEGYRMVLIASIALVAGGVACWWLASRKFPVSKAIIAMLLGFDACWVAWVNGSQWGFTPLNEVRYESLVDRIGGGHGRWFVYDGLPPADQKPVVPDSMRFILVDDSNTVVECNLRFRLTSGLLVQNGVEVVSLPFVMRPPRSTVLQSLSVATYGDELKKVLWLLGVSHVLSKDWTDGTQSHPLTGAPPRLVLVAGGVFTVRDVAGASRVYFPRHIRTSTDWHELLADQDVGTTYVVPEDQCGMAQSGNIRIMDSAASQLVVDVRGVRGMVVFRQERRPGWSASIDGVPARIATPNLFHSGVCLDGTNSILRLSFEPPGLRWQAILSTLALLAMAWIVVRRRAWDEGSATTRGSGSSRNP